MCLSCRTEVQIAEQHAFKIFTIDEEGRLQSAFQTSYKEGLYYRPNEKMRVDVEDANFFAFKELKNATSVITTFRGNNAIILPVTLYNVVAKGYMIMRSRDPQCMDGYYDAFEAKEIVVHDTPRNRAAFYDSIIVKFLDNCRWGLHLSPLVKLALTQYIPREMIPVAGRR